MSEQTNDWGEILLMTSGVPDPLNEKPETKQYSQISEEGTPRMKDARMINSSSIRTKFTANSAHKQHKLLS